MLERSKPLGITYSLLSFDWIYEKEFEMQMRYADRLISYSAALGMDCDIWERENLVPKRWPRLEYLCITHRVSDPITEEQAENLQGQQHFGRMQMPDDFPSAESTPLLKRLHLHSCSLQSPSQLLGLTNLTELRVGRALHTPNIPIWSISKWLEIIVGLPHLQRLALAHSLAKYERSRVDHSDKVYPLHLKEFILGDLETTISNFLRRLDLKITQIFHLVIHPSTNSIEGVQEIEHILIQISPIVWHTLTVNKKYHRNWLLSIRHNSVRCKESRDFGVGSEGKQPEGAFFERAHVGIEFYPPTFMDLPIPELNSVCQSRQIVPMFQPVFDQVINLQLFCGAGQVLNVNILSEILWKSSSCLRSLSGIDYETWPVIYCNVLLSSGSVFTSRTYDVHVPFLQALEVLDFSVMEFLPVDHPTIMQVLEFLKFKQQCGTPLRVLEGVEVIERDRFRALGEQFLNSEDGRIISIYDSLH